MKEKIRKALSDAGAVAVGFATAGEIDADIHEAFKNWIGEGLYGEMKYLERHIPLRRDTDSVLPGVRTVISLAFAFPDNENFRNENLPVISSYAYGEDYHIALRELLSPVVEEFRQTYGGEWRICIDSAPVAERYWAMKSGIGRLGLNGMIIVDRAGSFCYLIEILTTIEIVADKPSEGLCEGCGACIEECPGKALRGDGTLNACRCINYLTIEKKGDFTEGEKDIIAGGKGYLFGCDRCLQVCPHNSGKGKTQSKIKPVEIIKNLTPENILAMTREEFNRQFSRSPLRYAGYERLTRNASALTNSARSKTQ